MTVVGSIASLKVAVSALPIGTLVSPAAGTVELTVGAVMSGPAPVVVPDVMTYNPNAAPGWPNGRGYDDPVIDRLLAAALLRLGAPHGLNDLVGVINATQDETATPLPSAFPFLRAAYPAP